MNNNNRLKIHTLESSHIPFAMELKNLAGWNQTTEDWISYLKLERDGCFIAQYKDSADEGLAGTATALSYEGKVGWIGMVLVHPSKRKMGVGTALLEKSIQYLQNYHIPCIKLDATPMGKKVYEPLGFVEEYEVRRYQASGSASGMNKSRKYSIEIKSIKPEHIDLFAEWDANIFGANRRKVIEGMSQRNPELCLCYIGDRQIKGYIMAHKGHEAYQIGPFLADDNEVAEALFIKVMEKLEGQKVFVDVPVPNKKALEMVEGYDFTIQRSFCRMYLGQNLFPGQTNKVYGTSGAEKG